MGNEWVVALSGVLIALISGGVTLRVARLNKQNSKDTSELKARLNQSPLDSLEQVIEQLTKQRNDQRDYYENYIDKIEKRHKREMKEMEVELEDLKSKVMALQNKLREKRIINGD